MEKKKSRLFDIKVDLVSLVDGPAIRRYFLLKKSDKNIPGGKMDIGELVKRGLISKEDAELLGSDIENSENISKSEDNEWIDVSESEDNEPAWGTVDRTASDMEVAL